MGGREEREAISIRGNFSQRLVVNFMRRERETE